MVLRERLDKNYLNTENSGLSIYNQDYVKDYLAINEFMLSFEKNCTGKDVTKILSIEKFDPDKHQHAKAGNYKPYSIDEIWAVSSCDLKRLYRVYDMLNSKYVGIYPILDGE